MAVPPVGTPCTRVEMALELTDLGAEMLRQRLRREDPGITEAELSRAVRGWFEHRPGARIGDAPGRHRDVR